MQTHALVVVSKGELKVKNDWRLPSLSTGKVLAKIKTCGLNFADMLMISGNYQDTPAFPFVPGMEICAEIVDVGPGVTHPAVGDRIIAVSGSGGLAGHIVLDAAKCIPVPDTMDDLTAGGFLVAYGTSHLALTRRARLQAGETLVVLGAAGGVGLTAVEIGKALGARVIGIARGETKREIAVKAGADITIDAETDDLRAELKKLGPVNVVYDAVGGTLGEAALRSLAPEGRFLSIGFASGDVPQLRANHLLVKNVDVIGFYWGAYDRFAPEVLAESLRALLDMHRRDQLHPHISHALPFDQAEDGLDLLRSRQASGKVVITL